MSYIFLSAFLILFTSDTLGTGATATRNVALFQDSGTQEVASDGQVGLERVNIFETPQALAIKSDVKSPKKDKDKKDKVPKFRPIPLDELQENLGLANRGFRHLATKDIAKNRLHMFYREADWEHGKVFAEAVLKDLEDRGLSLLLPSKIEDRSSFSSRSPVVLVLNFLTSKSPYPQVNETALEKSVKSPFGFRNEVRGFTSKGKTKSVHVQEYFVPTFDALYWKAVSSEQTAELIDLNNTLGSNVSLHTSIFHSFGSTMAFLDPYLKLTTEEFLSGTKRVLQVLSISDSFSEKHLHQTFSPSPINFYIMGSGLRPSFHHDMEHIMAFVPHDVDVDLYLRWLITSHRFESDQPLEVQDCGWPSSLTSDFTKTVEAWWEQLVRLKDDQKNYHRSKFLCEPIKTSSAAAG